MDQDHSFSGPGGRRGTRGLRAAPPIPLLSNDDNETNRDKERPGPSNKRPRTRNHDNSQPTQLLQNTKRMRIDSNTSSLSEKKPGSAPASLGRVEAGDLKSISDLSGSDSEEIMDDFVLDEDLLREAPFAKRRSNGGTSGPGPVEAEQDSDHSNNSDKFYSQIIARENKKAQEKEQQSISAVTAVSVDLKSTANSLSELTSGSTGSSINRKSQVHVFMKLINPATNQVILETKEFKADMASVTNFLKSHDVDVSKIESGYAADVSASETNVAHGSSSALNVREEINNPAKYSLGSTITRPSDASTLSRPSVNSLVSNSYTKMPQRRNRAVPLLSSTRISDGDEHEVNDQTSTKSRDVTKSSGAEIVEQISTPRAPKSAKKNESSSFGSSTTMSNTFSSTTSSLSIKAEGNRGKKKDQVGGRNQEAATAAVDNFSDPSFVKSATLWGTVWPGAAVFARWRDGVYYSGKVWKRGLNDTWYIYFEDGMTDVASESHILPIKILGIGTWTVYSPQDLFKPENCVIAGQRFLDGTNDDLEKTEYALISEEDGRVIISNRKNLTIVPNDAKEMRKQYQVTITPKAADLSVENIVIGKRDRSAKMEPTPSNQIRAIVASLESTSKSKSSDVVPAFAKPQLNESSSMTTPTTSRKQPTTQAITPAIYKRNLAGSSSSRSKTKHEDASEELTPSLSNSAGDISIDESPSPTEELVPTRSLSGIESDSNSGKDEDEDPAQIFAKKYFFLTASGGGVDPATSTVVVAYDKEELRGMIETCGGTVLDGVGSEGRRRKNLFLISDNYARTVKYIYALAAGIPCVSFTWIIESFRKQKLVDVSPYELSAGFSIESEVVLPAHREKPLKGFQVYVTGATDELYKYWKPVLHAAGAIVPKRPHLKKGQSEALVPSHTDVLVTDMTCSLEVWEYARAKNIPVVKPEWLVQTIIAGKRVAFDGHEKYAVTELDAPNI